MLINGASGAVGTMAVQLAKHLGAKVTAVCSGANVELVRGLGADHVIDYTIEDFTRNGQRYDVIMDNHGNAPYARVKGSLKSGGRFLMVIGDLWQMLAALRQKAVISSSESDSSSAADYYRTLMELAERGGLKPVIDSVLPFAQSSKRIAGSTAATRSGASCSPSSRMAEPDADVRASGCPTRSSTVCRVVLCGGPDTD